MAARQSVTEGALRVKSCSLSAFADKGPGSFAVEALGLPGV